MPTVRNVRRGVTNENDENNTTRVTRAKAAALSGPNDGTKRSVQGKKTVGNAQAENEPARKRTALGDLSNVHKGGKDETTSKPTTGSKLARTNSTRSALGQKDKNTTGTKRSRSDTADAGNEAKKRSIERPTAASRQRSSTSIAEHSEENLGPPAKKIEIDVKETITKTATVEASSLESSRSKQQRTLLEEEDVGLSESVANAIDEMDDEDAHDPLMVTEYVYEIFDYMKELEVKTMPNPNYMEHQKYLEWKMRGVLVDWLLEVHTRFHLLPETLYLTVNLIDRFLSCKVVQLERLQLVGVTALFIASKYEEVLSPHIGNFRHVSDDTFTEAEILSAERFILSSLNYDLSFPNPMHFMRRISKADQYDVQTRTLAKYLLEISLLDHNFLHFRPSICAAASMQLARVILDKGSWDEILVHYSSYTEEEIKPAYDAMVEYLRRPVIHNAFYKKYAGKKFQKASLLARAWAKKSASETLE